MNLRIIACVLVFLSACKSTNKPTEGAEPDKLGNSWAASMQQLRESLTLMDPYLADESKFNDPANEVLIKTEIQKMADVSKNVTHNPVLQSQDPTVRFVASQFSQDLQRSAESFTLGKKDFSRYELMKVTGYCIECHTRTAQGPQFQAPTENKNLQVLNRLEKAEYYISARYFDQAMKLLEEEINSELSAKGGFTRFEKAAKYGLMITVQYEQNPDQALAFVTRIENSKSAPYAIKQKARVWKRDIAAWKKEKKDSKPKTLAYFQSLSANHDSEVSQMRALAGLLPMMTQDLNAADLGQSLYLVGTCYENLSDVTPISLQDNYFESCIHGDPHSDWSKKCYKKLEDSINFGYSGSGGVHIPIEIEVYLQALKKESE